MRLKILYSFITLLIFSCTPSSTPDEEEEPGVILNQAPEKPVLDWPTNNMICVDDSLKFKWDPSSDPEEDPVSYYIEISTDSQFSSIYIQESVAVSSIDINLNPTQNYFWRVKAKDNNQNESPFSDVWSLSTDGTSSVNNLPSTPEYISPTLGETLSSGNVELSWNSTDDDGDNLLYDLYFGTSEEPEIFEENLQSNTYDLSSLSSDTYYWKIVVKDNNEGQTIGQTYNFKVD